LVDVILHEIDLQVTGEGFPPPIYEKIVQSVGLTSRDVSTVKRTKRSVLANGRGVFIFKLEILYYEPISLGESVFKHI
jgi:hypothetical protein